MVLSLTCALILAQASLPGASPAAADLDSQPSSPGAAEGTGGAARNDLQLASVGTSGRGQIGAFLGFHGQPGPGGDGHGDHVSWMPVMMVVMVVALVAVGAGMMASRGRAVGDAPPLAGPLSPASQAVPVMARSAGW